MIPILLELEKVSPGRILAITRDLKKLYLKNFTHEELEHIIKVLVNYENDSNRKNLVSLLSFLITPGMSKEQILEILTSLISIRSYEEANERYNRLQAILTAGEDLFTDNVEAKVRQILLVLNTPSDIPVPNIVVRDGEILDAPAIDDPEGVYSETRTLKEIYDAVKINTAVRATIHRIETNPEVIFTDNAENLMEEIDFLINRGGISEREKIRLEAAKRGILIILGTLPGHPSSSIEDYRISHIEGIPNIMVLFSIAKYLSEKPTVQSFVTSWLAENIDLWPRIKALYVPHFSHINHSDVGLALGSDAGHGNTFVNYIARAIKSPDSHGMVLSGRQILAEARLLKPPTNAFIEKRSEALNNLIEALFMTARGHNSMGRLFVEEEGSDRPACAYGAQAQLLKAIALYSGSERLFEGVSLEACA